MRLTSSVTVLGIMAALAATSAAAAQQPAPPAKEKREERIEKRVERKEDRAERKEDRAERKEDRAERKEDREQSAEEQEKSRAERKARRDKRREELRQRWGALLNDAGVRGELKVHARRLARLRAIKRVAAAEGKKALVARVDKLLEKEQARHQRHMENLKAKNSGAPAASATAGAQ